MDSVSGDTRDANIRVAVSVTGIPQDDLPTVFHLFTKAHTEVDSGTAGEVWKASYGWLISVPKSAPVEQLELLDVRRCMSTQGASAHIMYRWRGQPLSVYVLNSVPRSDVHVEQIVARVGQEAIIWSDAGRTYAVVGRGLPPDLEHIAHYLRASTR